MNAFFTLLKQHPVFVLSCWSAAQYVWSVYASSLRAPTASASQAYLSWFAIVNGTAGNVKRIKPPEVESSPNFHAAVAKANAGVLPTSANAPPAE
jgi:hypothetical protein